MFGALFCLLQIMGNKCMLNKQVAHEHKKWYGLNKQSAVGYE